MTQTREHHPHPTFIRTILNGLRKPRYQQCKGCGSRKIAVLTWDEYPTTDRTLWYDTWCLGCSDQDTEPALEVVLPGEFNRITPLNCDLIAYGLLVREGVYDDVEKLTAQFNATLGKQRERLTAGRTWDDNLPQTVVDADVIDVEAVEVPA